MLAPYSVPKCSRGLSSLAWEMSTPAATDIHNFRPGIRLCNPSIVRVDGVGAGKGGVSTQGAASMRLTGLVAVLDLWTDMNTPATVGRLVRSVSDCFGLSRRYHRPFTG